jgi:hypothetical protein
MPSPQRPDGHRRADVVVPSLSFSSRKDRLIMTQTQTSTATLLAQSDRIAPEDVDLSARPRQTWLSVTGQQRGPLMHLIVKTPFYWIIARLRSNKEHRSDPLEMLDRIVVMLASKGWPESNLRLLEQHLGETITICKAGTAQRAPEQIDLEETQVEGQENNLASARLAKLAGGRLPDPDALEAEALQCRLEASNSIEKARSLERDARTLRSGRPPRVRRIRQAEAS